jgi:hypothetical protein
MKTWIDAVLCQSFAKSGGKRKKFVESWCDVIKLVVDGEALDKVIKCNGKYADARDALDDVVVSSNLGMELYSFALAAT